MRDVLDRLHMEDNDVDEEEVKSPIPPSAKALGKRSLAVEEVDDEHYDMSDFYYKPTNYANMGWPRRQPIQYIYDAAAEPMVQHLPGSGVDMVVGVHNSYHEPMRESIILDSDEEVRGGDHANTLLPRGQPTHYVYDAAAERTAQLDLVPITPSTKALGTNRVVQEVDNGVLFDPEDTMFSLAVVSTRPPMDEEIPVSKLDATLTASDHDLYWAGIDLDFATDTIFAYSSKANLEKMLWEDALLDAQKRFMAHTTMMKRSRPLK